MHVAVRRVVVGACLLWSAGAQVIPGAAAQAGGRDPFRNLPQGWTLVESTAVSAAQLDAIGRKLGAQLARLSNTKLAIAGQQLQVNILTAKTDDDAARAHQAMLRVHQGNHTACPRDGKSVVEFVGKDPRLIERAYLELGFKPPLVVYEVSFQAAPIEKCDYMVWNKMFNAFLAPQPNEMLIRDLSRSFVFSDRITLRDCGLGEGRSTFMFTPAAARTAPALDGEGQQYTFAALPRKHGVPQVGVVAKVRAEAFALTPSRRKPGQELLGPTEFWPSTDPQIIALAKQITADRTTSRDKVAALLAWFEPNNLRYGGGVTGSRYGVKKVLEQKTGHCWDFSDCFVTLCRASGVPCRQVLGWLHGQSGHVWAEVLIEGEGWRQVDPTARMGCDCRYIPYIASETGHAPLVYTSAVVIRETADR